MEKIYEQIDSLFVNGLINSAISILVLIVVAVIVNKIINKMESLGEKIKDYPIYQDLLDDEMLRKNGGENNRDLSVN